MFVFTVGTAGLRNFFHALKLIFHCFDSAVNLQQGLLHISHRTLYVSLHYFVKYKRSTIAILLVYLTQ